MGTGIAPFQPLANISMQIWLVDTQNGPICDRVDVRGTQADEIGG